MSSARASFFSTSRCCDITALREYIATHSVEEMKSDLETSTWDPNDLLCVGDIAFFQFKKNSYAALSYWTGLVELQLHPELIAPDIDMLKAAHNLVAVELAERRIDNAVTLINAEPRIVRYNPNLAVDMAYQLLSAGRKRDALPLLDRVLAIPMSELSEELGYPMVVVRKLRESAMG